MFTSKQTDKQTNKVTDTTENNTTLAMQHCTRGKYARHRTLDLCAKY